MAFWNIDLTTEDGAQSAAQNGGLACFIAAGFCVVGMALAIGTHLGSKEELIGVLAAMAGEMLVFVVAGFRLRAGKGIIWGGVAALLLAIEIVAKLVTLIGIPGIVVNIVMLVVLINGVRAALAMRHGDLNTDDVAKVFD
ncbi:hypothetical protein ACVWZA_003169 [Sphingomonas sp. UYAg733]